ncbi:MAG: hypothetical protein AB9836_12620 [Aminipila sp.]
MAYFSLFLSLFYLFSCPLIAIINVADFDNLYVFYPVMQMVAYILYLLKDFKSDFIQNPEQLDVESHDNKFDHCFNVFNVVYIIFLFVLFNQTMSVIVLSFALYPLGVKVAVIDAMFINDASNKESTKIGE